MAVHRLADRQQIRLGHRVHNGVAAALFFQCRERRPDHRRAARHRRERHQANRPVGLPRQHAHEVRVSHRRQRMVLHPAFRQQRIADEQMPLVYRPRIGGERRARRRKSAAQRCDQRVRHRADVPLVRAVERRAVLGKHLPASSRLQPGKRRKAFLHRLPYGRRAGLERDDDGVHVRRRLVRRRHADELDGAHAAAHQSRGEVGRPGEIIRDAAQQRHF